MRLDVPVGVDVLRVVFLVAADLDLLETPLGQDGVRSAEVAAGRPVAETETGRERVDAVVLVLRAAVDVVDDLDDPVRFTRGSKSKKG